MYTLHVLLPQKTDLRLYIYKWPFLKMLRILIAQATSKLAHTLPFSNASHCTGQAMCSFLSSGVKSAVITCISSSFFTFLFFLFRLSEQNRLASDQKRLVAEVRDKLHEYHDWNLKYNVSSWSQYIVCMRIKETKLHILINIHIICTML